MFVDLHRFIHILNKFPLQNIPEGTQLVHDVTGFSLKGVDLDDTKHLNDKWKNYLNVLNKIVGFEEYLTISEIATHLNMSQTTIHKIIKGQDKDYPVLPFIETSVGKRVKTSDYIAFLEGCYRPTSSSSAQNRGNPPS